MSATSTNPRVDRTGMSGLAKLVDDRLSQYKSYRKADQFVAEWNATWPFLQSPVKEYIEHVGSVVPQVSNSRCDAYWNVKCLADFSSKNVQRVYECLLELYHAMARAIEYHHTKEARKGVHQWPEGLPYEMYSYKDKAAEKEDDIIRIVERAVGSDATPGWAWGTPWLDVLVMIQRVLDGARATRIDLAHAKAVSERHHAEVARVLLAMLLPWRYLRILWHDFPSRAGDHPGFHVRAAAKSQESSAFLPGSAVDVLGWRGYLLFCAFDPKTEKETDCACTDLSRVGSLEPVQWQRIVPLVPFVVAPSMLDPNPVSRVDWCERELETRQRDERSKEITLDHVVPAPNAIGLVESISGGPTLRVKFTAWPEWASKLTITACFDWTAFQPCDRDARSFVWLHTTQASLPPISSVRSARLDFAPKRTDGDRPPRLLYISAAAGPVVGITRNDRIAITEIPINVEVNCSDGEKQDLAPHQDLILPGAPLTFSDTLRDKIESLSTERSELHRARRAPGSPSAPEPGLSGELFAVDAVFENRRTDIQHDDWQSVEKILRLLRPVARDCPWLPDLYGRGTWKQTQEDGRTDHAILLHQEVMRDTKPGAWGPFRSALIAPPGEPWKHSTTRLLWALWTALTLGRALRTLSSKDELKLQHGHVSPNHLLFHFSMSRIVLNDFSYGVSDLRVRKRPAARYDYDSRATTEGSDQVAFLLFSHDLMHLGLAGTLPNLQLDGDYERRKAQLDSWLGEPFPGSAFDDAAGWSGPIGECLGQAETPVEKRRQDSAQEKLRELVYAYHPKELEQRSSDLPSLLEKKGQPSLLKKKDQPSLLEKKDQPSLLEKIESAFESVLAVTEMQMLRELAELASGRAPAAGQGDSRSLLKSRSLLPGWDSQACDDSDPLGSPDGRTHRFSATRTEGDLAAAWDAVERRIGPFHDAQPWRKAGMSASSHDSHEQNAAFIRALVGALGRPWQSEQRRCSSPRNDDSIGGDCIFALPMGCRCTRPLRSIIASLVAEGGAQRPEQPAQPSAMDALLALTRLVCGEREAGPQRDIDSSGLGPQQRVVPETLETAIQFAARK